MTTSAAPSRWTRLRGSLTRAEWRRAAGLAAVIAGLHVAGFLLLVAVVAPQRFELATTGVFGVGLGITAYVLGVRHAFDADHLAAIDNTTRKLMSEGQRPLSVGFWFALGHSTIVFALGVLVVLGVRGLDGAVRDEGSALQQATGLIGPVVSGTFLLIIGLLNLVILVSLWRIFRRMRHGELDEAALEHELANRGLLARFYGRMTRAVRKPWQMYPLGLLFGLGFDTATEVALLVLAGAGAASGLPFYAILCLPILFAAGMTLFDTLDGAFMSFAYGWSLTRPVRKVFYNLAITGLSVAVALLIGGVELLAVLAERLSLTGGLWDMVTGVDLNTIGYAVAGLFVATWALSVAVWRFGHIEERWSADVR
jgi:high-affinity nickel-transport protein